MESRQRLGRQRGSELVITVAHEHQRQFTVYLQRLSCCIYWVRIVPRSLTVAAKNRNLAVEVLDNVAIDKNSVTVKDSHHTQMPVPSARPNDCA